MTCYQEIACPKCQSNEIVTAGHSPNGVQRYRCKNPECPTKSFMLQYRYRAYEPGIKTQLVDMAINRSGVQDTVRAGQSRLNYPEDSKQIIIIPSDL